MLNKLVDVHVFEVIIENEPLLIDAFDNPEKCIL